jgi:hypothetical protein
MESRSKILSIVLLGSSLLCAQSTNQVPGPPGGTQTPNSPSNPTAQSRLIHILTPVAGQASASNAIRVRYELTNPSADAGDPNFQIQLDGTDPVSTTATEYTFTGLAPGAHSVTVMLVDANGTPIGGGTASVQFTVKNLPAVPRADVDGAPAENEVGGAANQTAGASNNLPMLSLIGFGVLIGGVASAFKTRE